MLAGEKSFFKEKTINYIFKQASWKCPFLIVVFSGFNNPTFKEQHPYHYLRALSQFDMNVLFIQDTCGSRGCYYLCEHMDFSVERTVYSLIEEIAKQAGIEQENIIAVGSSKGGTAAIYYGLKYRLGHVIAGVPQTKIASYLLECKGAGKPVLDYMLMSDDWDTSFQKLDEVVFDQLAEGLPTKVYLYLSENDHLWKDHFVPLLHEFELKNVQYEMVNDLEIKNHGEISYVFPGYLRDVILRILAGHKVNMPVVLEREGDILEVVAGTPEWQYTINPECEEYLKTESPTNKVYDFSHLKQEIFEVRVLTNFVYNNRIIYSTALYEGFFPRDSLCISGCHTEIKGDILHVDLLVNSRLSLEYAFYLIEDGVKTQTVWYTPEKQAKFKIQKNKTYRIQYFVKTPRGRVISQQSEKINSNQVIESLVKKGPLQEDRFRIAVQLYDKTLTTVINHTLEDQDTKIHYHFYLIKDGIAIEKCGWFTENTYSWVLAEHGIYKVHGYVLIGKERMMFVSDSVVFQG